MPRARKPSGPEVTALIVAAPGQPALLVPTQIAAASLAMLHALEKISMLSDNAEIVGVACTALAAAKGPR